jgi:cell filamentation protein
LATLNAIHAFRDGNGRSQLAFFAMLAAEADHPLYTDELDPDDFLQAMIASFSGDELPLRQQLVRMTI